MRTGILAVPILFCMLISAASLASGAPSHVHMTWTGDPRHTIVISWSTGGDEPSIVEYGTQLPYTESASGPAGKLHHVALEGLESNTVYHFRCGSATGWSEDLTFKTAPDVDDPFTFVSLGDSRTNWAIWGQCSEAVLAASPDFFLHTGDLVASGGDQSEWDIWFDEAKALLSTKVMMPAIGNHEDNHARYYQQFALPQPEDWYSFDYGNAHFIALTTEKSMTGAQREWLENDLASTNATWKFVYYHRPMYSSSSHGGEESVRQAWEDLLNKYHVDMVFNGHDHCYERTYPMFDEWLADPPDTGTIHVVTGAAGAPLYGLSAKGPWSAHFLSDYHFVLLTINGTELHFEARLYDQTVFDEIHISKSILPDLQVAEIVSNPRYPSPDDSAIASIRVENNGKARSPETDLGVAVDAEPAGVVRVGPLEPGEFVVIQANLPRLDTGLHDITVVADSGGDVYEGYFEDNNQLSASLLVSEPMPDLEMTEIFGSSLMPTPGEEVKFGVRIQNSGSAPAGEFHVLVELDDQTLTTLAHGGLAAGEEDLLEVPWSCEVGDWELNVALDPAGVVEELFEDNNNGSRSFVFLSFVKDGPAYLPQGFNAGDTVALYYDVTEGEITADSGGCVAVWGINGWRRPPSQSAPTGTMVGGVFQTQMTSISEGIYTMQIQTTEEFEWIDLKFYDRQALPKAEDTNNGSFWIVPSRQWASSKLSELIEAIQEAEQTGVDTVSYWAVVTDANATLRAGRYLEAAQMIIDTTESCRYDECIYLIDAAAAVYEEAVQEGLEVSRANSFLTAARNQLERENYYGSKTFSLRSMEYVEQVRAEAPEWPTLMVLLLTLPLLRVGSQIRVPRTQEH